ncbi:hypothetical protein SKAU_G00347600 [Synaphobranchus kaupii]|uniref:Uncharacterized protein n=1 Tax=Synaphobranchus kaupii TaxID=118154 RepID=A0A9Q1IHM8_SYNKA|nr:hypothetical protein SKAU_G00347600 [Synaphobranchus kaupii]
MRDLIDWHRCSSSVVLTKYPAEETLLILVSRSVPSWTDSTDEPLPMQWCWTHLDRLQMGWARRQTKVTSQCCANIRDRCCC